MAKRGTEKKPVRFRAQTEERLGEIAAICEDNGWKFVGALEPDEPEDISEVEYLLSPDDFDSQPLMAGGETVVRDEPKVGRNDPCPCGSGKKYKKCCLA